MDGLNMLHTRFVIAFAALATLVAAGSPARAQGLVTQKSLSADMTQAIIQAVVEKCRADGFHVSVTVVNADGLLKGYLRDDGAAPHTIDLSRKKAYTAVTQRRATTETAKAYATGYVPNIVDIVGLGGGVPIKVGNDVIAAVGVSGAPSADRDEVCALAGIAKISDKLK
jgi:uncharacterized protein GlcG (DUF336 family)